MASYQQQIVALSKQQYYSQLDAPLQAPQQTLYKNVLVAATACFGVAVLWLGLTSGTAGTTYLRTQTLDLGVYQGTNGLETGVEVDDNGGKVYRAAALKATEYGNFRAGLEHGDGENTQTLDYSHKEGNTAFKLGLKKAGEAAWKWKAGTETTGTISAKGIQSSGLAKSAGGQPLTVKATVGADEGEVKWDAGVKSTDGDLTFIGGIKGGGSGKNTWGLRGETASSNKPGSWKVTVNTGN